MNSSTTGRIELHALHLAEPRAYRVAGMMLVTTIKHSALAAYAVDDSVEWTGGGDPMPAGSATVKTFDSEGLIGDGYRHVVCRVGPAGYELSADGLGAFHIGHDGHIFIISAEPEIAANTMAVTALGAPLILALALRGVFCLHASVVTCEDRLLAFIGESGAGKSTLARFLGEKGGPEWRRVIDDTLPIAPVGGDGVFALPHFPQLKLADEMQPARLVAERVPLHAVYVLEDSGDEIAIAPLRRSEASLALAAQTVGGRLFGRDLLAEHLLFCGEMADRAPVRRLAYPRSFDRMPAVRDALVDDLEG